MSKKLQDARKLWSICFPADTEGFLDYYFSRIATEDDTYILYDETKTALAHIGILRYTYMLGEKRLQLAYISGACTHPDYRKKGLMNRLMSEVIDSERTKGMNALILIPADDMLRVYYNKTFGFQNAASLGVYSLEDYWGYFASKETSHHWFPRAKDIYYLLQRDYQYRKYHISFTLKQARDIIDEYVSTEGAYSLSVYDHNTCVGLLLARIAQGVCYIDSIIGDYRTQKELIKNLSNSLGIDVEIKVNNIFDSIDTHMGEFIPWGMFLPLAPTEDSEIYKHLGISLVHN